MPKKGKKIKFTSGSDSESDESQEDEDQDVSINVDSSSSSKSSHTFSDKLSLSLPVPTGASRAQAQHAPPLLVAAIGQEHRLGRWQRIKEARNVAVVIPLVFAESRRGATDIGQDED